MLLFYFFRWQSDCGPFNLSRGTIGKDQMSYISTWNVRQIYKIKVMGAANINVSDTMKVSGNSECTLYACMYCTCTVHECRFFLSPVFLLIFLQI